MLTSALTTPSRAVSLPAAPEALAEGEAELVVAILSDNPEPFAEAARAAGIIPDRANAETLWLLPANAPDMLLLDLPVTGVSNKRISLLVNQLCRICPDLVIIMADTANSHSTLPRDIELAPTPEATTEALSEARHLLSPRYSSRPLFYHRPARRMSLFR